MTRVRIGCSGWNYRDWRGTFYPDGLPARRWLEHYAGVFDTVEVNATFYRLPSRDAVARWVQQTPEEFQFTVKASRYLTHMRRLRDMDEGVARFYERIEPLVHAGRLGPLLWQLPERFPRDDEVLAHALAHLPPGRHAFEFRHASWFVPEVGRLLEEHDAAFVLAHDPRRELPAAPQPTRWRFARLHHGERGRAGNYSEAELSTWARRIARWQRGGDVYAYLNDDWQAFAPRNAAFLRAAVTAARPEPSRCEQPADPAV
jgi:uncharacterized protein YecE (DUF72 family)